MTGFVCRPPETGDVYHHCVWDNSFAFAPIQDFPTLRPSFFPFPTRVETNRTFAELLVLKSSQPSRRRRHQDNFVPIPRGDGNINYSNNNNGMLVASILLFCLGWVALRPLLSPFCKGPEGTVSGRKR